MSTDYSKNNPLNNPQKIEVVSYNPTWPDFFRKEADKIQALLGSLLEKIYHIGSTAIPNMPAKSVIDMMLVLNNLDDISLIAEKLALLNYCPIRRQIIPHQSFFTRRQEKEISFHLHLHEKGSPQIKRHVNFRDYVIHHPEEALAYSELKIQLAKKFSNDSNAYVFGKDKLVQQIDAKAKVWEERNKKYLPPNTGPIAEHWSPQKIVNAMEANLNVHMTHFAQYLNQIELIRIPGFTIVNTHLPDDTFNYVLDADFSEQEADKKISEINTYFSKKNSPFSWWVSPQNNPRNLSNYLEKYGYQNSENNVAMYLNLDTWNENTPPPPELKIIRATNEATLHDFALVLCNDPESFKTYFSWIASVLTEDDPIEYYVGYINGKPVVRGLSCYFSQVAGLHWLSTAPDERKKGYGTALQNYRLKRAKELGYHIAVLQASNEGYSLYKKLGYKECGTFKEFKLKESVRA